MCCVSYNDEPHPMPEHIQTYGFASRAFFSWSNSKHALKGIQVLASWDSNQISENTHHETCLACAMVKTH